MTRPTHARAAVVLPILAVMAALLAAVAPPGSPAAGAGPDDGAHAAARASLRVTPSEKFVGGQRLTWSGTLGVRGVRRIILQTNDERAGDTWVDVDGFSTRTKANGSFSFAFPAPANFDITYRVKGAGNHVTPLVRFNYPILTSQEVNLTMAGDVGDESQVGVAPLNQAYTLVADTTPSLSRRPDTIGLQPIPGRTVNLQTRTNGGGWTTVDTGTTDGDGFARFDRPAETQAGTQIVYRVRQENWFKNGDKIGWQPSFPLFVTVANARRAARLLAERDAAATSPSGGAVDLREPTASNTASQRYGWAPSLFDFAWTYGESLTSKPGRGTLRKGKWIDDQGGSGRVSHFNDGLGILSKRLNDSGRGDFGTTRATLQGNARPYGRWEVRLRAKTSEGTQSVDNDFHVVLELVPENATTDVCRTITVADYQVGAQLVRFGANNGRNAWADTSGLGRSQNVAIAFAVEVTRDHITWFREGDPIGTIDNDNAISGAALTPRLSLVGDPGDAEMDGTDVISDWQRGFDLGRGRQVEAGGAVPTTQAPGAC